MGLSEDADTRARLTDWLTSEAGGAVEIARLAPLAGGAIQENWALDIDVSGGPWAGRHALVLRKDAPTAVATSHGRLEEFALLKRAHDAGVTVPVPCLACADPDILGTPFFLMHRVHGEAAGHRLAKRDFGDQLADDLGRNLARLHAVRPPDPELEFLAVPAGRPAEAAIATYRDHLDELQDPAPAVEWGLAWLARNAPPAPKTLVLCHRDYRTGNYLVSDDGRLAAVLDWEFAGWSDPLEDIGWFCAKCWRFGNAAKEAGGIGDREAFYRAYEDQSGRTIDRAAVAYWEVMAHVRWAVIALQQADRFVSGGEANLELALTAHVVPELEWEILAMTGEG